MPGLIPKAPKVIVIANLGSYPLKLDFSPCNRYLATLFPGQQIGIWDLKERQWLFKRFCGGISQLVSCAYCTYHNEPAVIIGDARGNIHMYNKRGPLGKSHIHDGGAITCILVRNNQAYCLCSNPHELIIWKRKKVRTYRNLEHPQVELEDLSISPDGTQLFYRSELLDKISRLDLTKQVSTTFDFDDVISKAWFSHDGKKAYVLREADIEEIDLADHRKKRSWSNEKTTRNGMLLDEDIALFTPPGHRDGDTLIRTTGNHPTNPCRTFFTMGLRQQPKTALALSPNRRYVAMGTNLKQTIAKQKNINGCTILILDFGSKALGNVADGLTRLESLFQC